MEALPQLLQTVLSPDNVRRTAAERQLDELSAAPGFLAALVALFCDHLTSAPPSMLMVTLSVLKQKMTQRSAPGDLCGVARALLQSVILNTAVGGNGAKERQFFALVKQGASAITKAIVLLEGQVSGEGGESGGDTAAAAAQNLSALLPFAFQEMGALLTPLADPPPPPPSATDSAAAHSALPRRALALLQEMADVLPDHDCIARNDYLLSTVPIMFRIATRSTPPSAFLAATTRDKPHLETFTYRLRCQVEAAHFLVTVYSHRAALRKLRANLGDAAPAMPDTESFRSLRSFFTEACQGALTARIVDLRLASVSTEVQRLLASPAQTPSLPMNELLLFVELECQLLSLVPLAAKAAFGKVAVSSPESWPFSVATLKGVHTALKEDVVAYHAALRVGSEASADGAYGEGDWESYERTHDDDALLDREEAVSAFAAKIRKCSELRWRLVDSGVGAAWLPARLAVGWQLDVIHTAAGIADEEKAYAEVEAYFHLFLQYAFLSFRDAALWAGSPNEFLRREDEKDLLWTLRDVVALMVCRLCRSLGGYFTTVAVESVFGVLMSLPGTASQPAAQGAEAEQTREAAMFLMESILRTCRKEVIACGEADFSPLVHTLLGSDVASSNTAVAARALTLLGTLFTFIAKAGWGGGSQSIDQQRALVLASAVASLSDAAGAPPLIRACACKLLLELIPLSPADVLLEAFTEHRGQQALLALLAPAPTPSSATTPAFTATGEALYVVLDVLSVWLARLRTHTTHRAGAAAEYREPTAHRALFACWRQHLQDPNVNEAVLEVFAEYIRDPGGDDAFMAKLPWLEHLLMLGKDGGAGAAAELCSIPAVVQLLAQVFLRGSERAANATASATLGSLCTLLLSTDESAILDASSSCLATLLRRCPQAESVCVPVPPSLLRGTQDEHTQGVHDASLPSVAAHVAGLDEERQRTPLTTVLLAIALHMLAPQRTEVSLLNVGKVLVAIVEHAPHFSSEEVQRLIDTIAHRLESVRTPSVLQQLIAPLSVLLHSYPEAFLQVLRQGGMLERTFACWLPQVAGFFGKRDVLRSCEAFVLLLTNWDQSGLQGVKIAWRQPSRSGGGGGGVAGQKRVNDANARVSASTTAAQQLPLDVALFLSIGQCAVVLAEMLESGEWWELEKMERDDIDGGDLHGSGARMWQEGSSSSDDDDDDVYEDCSSEEEQSEGDDATILEQQQQQQHQGQDGDVQVSRADSAKQQLRSVFVAMPPLLNRYGSVVAPFFTASELNAVQQFFYSVLSA